ncbi:MAG: DUF418 domain-containing protein [Bacteroidia bacterium]
METLASTPLSLKERYFSIDVLRGFALLGILLINICNAGLPGPYAFGQIYFFKLNPNDYYGWFIVDLFASGKMRCLFSMLFGAGIILFTQKRDEQQLPVAGLYYRRTIWLLVFGLIDMFIILFAGDILVEYATCGLLLFLFRRLKPTYLIGLAGLCLIFLSWNAGKTFFKNKENRRAFLETEQLKKRNQKPTEEQLQRASEWVELMSRTPPFNQERVNEVRRMVKEDVLNRRTGYTETFLNQALVTIKDIGTSYLNDIWETLSAMLIGMALFRWRFFTGELKTKTYWIIAFICFVVGIPLAYESTWLIHGHSAYFFDKYIDSHSFSPRMYEQVPRLLLPIGYASVLILFYLYGWMNKLTYALSCVGRMAFTNYLSHNIFYTLLFYGHGLAMFALFSRMQLYYIAFAIWAVQIVFSIIWLKYFQMGPLEWLWRSLTYKKFLPNKA